MNGRLHTRYAPVRRSPSKSIATPYAAPRLACVRPAASVYPEPGSNSPLSMLSWSLASEFNVALSCTRPYLSDNLFDCLSVLAIFILSRNSFLDPSLNGSFSCGCQRSPADLLLILRDSLSPFRIRSALSDFRRGAPSLPSRPAPFPFVCGGKDTNYFSALANKIDEKFHFFLSIFQRS